MNEASGSMRVHVHMITVFTKLKASFPVVKPKHSTQDILEDATVHAFKK